MADSEKDFARFSSHNGTYQYNYLPRLNFAPEGSRNLAAPHPSHPSIEPPRQSVIYNESPHHHHPAPLESNYTSRRAASTDQNRHHNGIHHNPSFLSRHDPNTVNARPRPSAINHEPPYMPPAKNSIELPHQHGCPTCEANNNYPPPQRTSSPDSFHNTGNAFLNEDMSEEAALQKIKTAQSVNMSPEVDSVDEMRKSNLTDRSCSRNYTSILKLQSKET